MNKTIISTVDGFFIPTFPDMFSLYGIKNIKAQNIANIPNEIVTQPIGSLSVMYTHNTYPSVAQSLKCPMRDVPGIYSKMRQDNKEYLEENQITVNNEK